MSKTIDASFIDDIFGIPTDGSNIGEDESEAYAGLGDQKGAVPFEAKVAELGTEIKSAAGTVIPAAPVTTTVAPEKAPEKVVTKKEPVTPPAKKEEAEKAAKSVIPADPTSTTSMFGDIFGDEGVKTTEPKKVEVSEPPTPSPVPAVPTPEPTPVVEKEEPKATPKAKKSAPVTETVSADDLGNNAQPQPSQPSAPLRIAGKDTTHKWFLDSPAPKYNTFYGAKRGALLDALLKGGELPFDQYFTELEEANVDVAVGETFNAELVCTKMAECQRHRERIKQIQLRVNRQFFQWERHMDLFGGLLARIDEVRGVEKRDGIRYEHMYDMESYYGELKALHKSIDNVMRVLDSAFECLSRQVTVTMPMKDVERYNTGPKPMTPTLQRFDGLKTQANSGGSIATAKPNEAAKAAEPTQKKSGWDI